MLGLFKNLKIKDWVLVAITVLLIIVQVSLELKLPDYTNNLTKIVQSENATMSEMWKNGGLMLACAGGIGPQLDFARALRLLSASHHPPALHQRCRRPHLV